MTISFLNGSITATSTEENIVNITADEHFALWVFAHNMAAGDSFRIRVYVLDSNTSTLRIWIDETLSGVQSSPAFFIPFIPAKQYRVSIQKIAGTDRTFSWLRARVV